MIEEIKRIEDLIRRKSKLLEEIPTNVKEQKIRMVKNSLNTELDILYSKIKYDGKIRLFVFDIYINKLCNNMPQYCVVKEGEEDTIFITKLSKIGIKRTQLEDKAYMYYVDDKNLLQYYDYNSIRVYSRYYDGYECS
jgi:hypothetical protein